MNIKNIYSKIIITAISGIYLYILLVFGIGLSEDAVSYCYAAQTFTEQVFMKNIDGSAFVHWPPLMPFLIGILSLLSEKLLLLLPLLSIVLTLWACILWANKLLKNRGLRLLLLILFAFNFALVYTAPMLWSDLLFLALFLFWLYALDEKNTKRVILLFVLMSLLRYAALFFLPLLLLYLYRNYSRAKGFRSFAQSILYSIAPIALWLTYTYLQSGHISGARMFPAEYFADNSEAIASELGKWVLPAGSPYFIHVLATAFVLILPLWLIRAYQYVILAHLTYAAGIIISYFLFDMQAPDARLLLPLVPAFLFAMLLLIEQTVQQKKHVFLAILLLWCSYSVIRGGKLLLQQINGDFGKYNRGLWQEAQSKKLCTDIATYEDKLLISNDAYGLNYLCNKEAMIWPKDIYFLKADSLPDKGIFIWIRQKDPYQLYTPSAILSVYKSDTLLLRDNWILMQLEKH
ncbi:MAG: hypothetical protein WD048_03600 [Chitinophagales bacterium]